MKTLIEVSWIDGRTFSEYERIAPVVDQLTEDTDYHLENIAFLVVDHQIKFTFVHDYPLNIFERVTKAFEAHGLDEGAIFMLAQDNSEQTTH